VTDNWPQASRAGQRRQSSAATAGSGTLSDVARPTLRPSSRAAPRRCIGVAPTSVTVPSIGSPRSSRPRIRSTSQASSGDPACAEAWRGLQLSGALVPRCPPANRSQGHEPRGRPDSTGRGREPSVPRLVDAELVTRRICHRHPAVWPAPTSRPVRAAERNRLRPGTHRARSVPCPQVQVAEQADLGTVVDHLTVNVQDERGH
jgi:hypothetical protein